MCPHYQGKLDKGGGKAMEKGKRRFVPAGVVTTIFAAALISGFFSAPFAAAQEEKSKQETAQEEKARGKHELGTMTVTAQKQEENVQEVPISVSVLSGLELEDHNIDHLWKIADFVPNLMFQDIAMSNKFSQPTMRGIYAPATTFASSVGLYVDGVPFLSSPGFATGLLDVERVEVLRGPQGTLYGKNTEAGAINIITRQPDNTLRGKIMAQGGEDKKGLLTASVSGPILEDRLFLAFPVSTTARTALWKTLFGVEQTMTARTGMVVVSSAGCRWIAWICHSLFPGCLQTRRGPAGMGVRPILTCSVCQPPQNTRFHPTWSRIDAQTTISRP